MVDYGENKEIEGFQWTYLKNRADFSLAWAYFCPVILGMHISRGSFENILHNANNTRCWD